jgi:hypothetical protein
MTKRSSGSFAAAKLTAAPGSKPSRFSLTTPTPRHVVARFRAWRTIVYVYAVRDGEQQRFLHRNAGLNYTGSTYRAARHEPQAVSEREQQDQTLQAHRRWQEQRQRAWGQAHRQINGALETFVRDGHPDRRLLSDVRAIARQAARIDRELGL